MQPIAADDIAAMLAEVAVAKPLRGTIELAGPEQIRLDELVRKYLRATNDPREVVTDAEASYFGIMVNDQSLVPGTNPRLGATHFADWLSHSVAHREVSHAA